MTSNRRFLGSRLAPSCGPLALVLSLTSCVDTSPPPGDEAAAGHAAGGAPNGASGGSAATIDAPPIDVAALAQGMGVGVNIGNTLENTTAWETGWGQPPITREFIAGMAASGFKSIRLPVAWDTYAQDGVIPADKLARVRQVAEWILDAGMFVVVNIHWDGGWIRNDGTASRYRLTDDVREKFAGYWRQIADELEDLDHTLILEAMNEEGEFYVGGRQANGPDYAPLNELNQLFVDTVRASGGYNTSRALLISGFATDIGKTCVDQFAIPRDPAGEGRLLLSIHYYTPATFTILEDVASWGRPATTWGTESERSDLTVLFETLADWSLRRQIIPIIGEFAVVKGDKYPRDSASRTLWMSDVVTTSLSFGMVPMLWDTGLEVNRVDGSLVGDFASVMQSAP